MTRLIPVVNGYDHVYGNPLAPIQLVEYGDYECQYCGRAYYTIKNIQEKLGAKLKFAFRNFPLSQLHPHAFYAAVATEAAGLQDKFWEMHDIIFENQKTLDSEDILLFAVGIGLDLESFKSDIQQIRLAEKVNRDFESGIKSGVNRTPSFFINGYKYEGEWMGDELYQYLKGLLRGSCTSY